MKKTFLLLTTLAIFISNLDARENPFAPTKAYEDEMARLAEINEDYIPKEFMGGDNNIETEDMTPVLREYEVNKPHPDAVAKTEEEIMKAQKEEAEKLAKENALNEALKKAEMAKKEAEKAKKEKEKALAKAKELEQRGPVVYVKKRDDITVSESLEVLPFLSLTYTDKDMTINSEYPVFKKFYLEDEKKLIIDFKGDVTFYTKRYDLESKEFKKLVVGNHKGENYFRLVVQVANDPQNYDVTYNDNSVFISTK